MSETAARPRTIDLSEVTAEQFRDLVGLVARNNLWDDALAALAREGVDSILVSTRAIQVIQQLLNDLLAQGRLSLNGQKAASVILTNCSCGSSTHTTNAGSDAGSRGGVLPKGSSSPPM